MPRRRGRTSLGIALAPLLSCVAPTLAEPTAAIVIYADDVGYRDRSCCGAERIDRAAAYSVPPPTTRDRLADELGQAAGKKTAPVGDAGKH